VPTVARDGEFAFIVHTRELPFEPPHVHTIFGGDEIRIELGKRSMAAWKRVNS
jgi:hypothetical protein